MEITQNTYVLSYYVIPVDNIDNEESILLYSSRSGKKVIISKDVWQSISNDNIDELPEEIVQHLKKLSILIPKGENELALLLDENRNASQKTTNGVLYEVIQPSAFCQMGCYYCGQHHENKNVDNKNIERIAQRIIDKLIEHQYSSLIIGWFGAEPLVGLDQMRAITEKLKMFCSFNDIKYSSKVVTNGLRLSESILLELVNELNVSKIEITIDGTEENHDKHRFLKNGKGTFKTIYKNVNTLIRVKEKYNLDFILSIRCNVDMNNSDNVTELIEMLREDGILSKINFYPIGIYEWGDKKNEESLEKEKYAKKEIGWFVEMLDNGYNVSNSLIPNRTYNTCLTTKKNSEVYDTYGNVFNCTEIPYTTDAKKSPFFNGKIYKELKQDSDTHLSNWYDIVQKEESLPCHTCKLLPVCGGGCPKSWMEGNVPCPTFKFNHKDRLRLYNKLRTATQGTKEEFIHTLKNEFVL